MNTNAYWGQWKINLIHFGLIISCCQSTEKATICPNPISNSEYSYPFHTVPGFSSALVWLIRVLLYLFIYFPVKLIPSVESTTAKPTWFNIPLMKILLSPDGALSMSVLLQTWHWLLLGCIFLSMLHKDFMLFDSRNYAMFLWGLHFLYLPSTWSRCFIYLSAWLRPNKFEPQMKPDSSWDSLLHLCISCKQRHRLTLLRMIFQVCVCNSLGRQREMVFSPEKRFVLNLEKMNAVSPSGAIPRHAFCTAEEMWGL